MKKIVFLGSKAIGYQCLKYLLDKQTLLDAQVIAIGTANKNNPLDNEQTIEQLCQQHQLPMFQKLSHLPTCDFIISVQYHKILKAKHIACARQLAINLHMAPLPEYRGCNQFSFAIVDGVEEFGTTIHQLEEGIDSGSILFEKRFPIPKNCFVKDLYQLTYEHSIQLFQSHISDILTGNYTPIPQANLLATRPTSYHFRQEINDLKQIDLSWDREKIERHIRATYFPPFEPPYAMIDNRKVYFSF